MTDKKTIVVTGAAGFIGGHMCKRLRDDGHYVIGVDNHAMRYRPWADIMDEFVVYDLRYWSDANDFRRNTLKDADQLYHFAADMGGMGHIANNHYDILMHNLQININVAKQLEIYHDIDFLFSSSVCVYPEFMQGDAFLDHPAHIDEHSAYPAQPQDEYGWEKLIAERIFTRLHMEHGVNAHIARFHNTFGPYGAWIGGREKAPAALCRKVAISKLNGQDPITIDVWGDGEQKRPFIYIDDTIEACIRLMATDFHKPVNIGPSNNDVVTINALANMIWHASNGENPRYMSDMIINHVPGAEGVRSRGASNELLQEVLGWKPEIPLYTGLYQTYQWVEEQVRQSANDLIREF